MLNGAKAEKRTKNKERNWILRVPLPLDKAIGFPYNF
jgi:hypothetical protein